MLIIFAFPFGGREFHGVMVAQLILVQLVLVRIQVELRKKVACFATFFILTSCSWILRFVTSYRELPYRIKP